MEKENMDVLYHLASGGDKACFNNLYEDFLNMGKIISIKVIQSNNATKFIRAEYFYDVISEVFLYAINNFDPSTSKFEVFARYLLTKRLSRAITESPEMKERNNTSLDDLSEDERLNYEIIANPQEQSVQDLINDELIKNYLQKNIKGRSSKTLNSRVLQLLLAGCSQAEICDILKITIGQLKYILSKLRKNYDLDKFNFK